MYWQVLVMEPTEPRSWKVSHLPPATHSGKNRAFA